MRTRLLAAAAAILLVAGCSSDRAPEGTDAHTHIDPVDPAHLGADQLATLAMGVILSWQPVSDDSPTDALRRAQRWLGGDLLRAATAATPNTVRPDPRWQAWRASDDSVTAACVLNSPAIAVDNLRTRVIDVTCTQTVMHRSGEMTPLPREVWQTSLTSTDHGWRMTGYRFLR